MGDIANGAEAGRKIAPKSKGSAKGGVYQPRRPDLYHATREHLALVQAIRNSLGDDEQTIADTIEGESRIEDAIAGVIREAKVAEAMAVGLKGHMDQLAKRAERLRHKAELLLAHALTAAEECGVTKVSAPDFTATVGQSQGKVIIVDEEQLPADCVRVKYEPNRALIRGRLMTGVDVPGAELSNSEAHWTVRVI